MEGSLAGSLDQLPDYIRAAVLASARSKAALRATEGRWCGVRVERGVCQKPKM